MQTIPYNPQADPKQYVGQLVNNLVSEILGAQEEQRRGREIQGLGRWASEGFMGQMPQARTDIGQQMAARLTSSLYQQPKVGAQPWAATQMTPAQKKNWLENYGRGVTIQTGQKLLPEADRIALAEADRDKALGIAGPGFGPGDKKALGEEMDKALDNARSGFFKRVGLPDYTEDTLFREWKQFIAKNTFTNDNQRENTWAAWRQKVNQRGKDWLIDNEVEWDPTDPKWREAIGLTAPVEGYQQPKTSDDFEKTISIIKNPKQQEIYFNKWKHLWPDEYK